MHNNHNHFRIQRVRRFEVHYELIPDPKWRNRTINKADRFRIHCISNSSDNKSTHYNNHTEKAIVKNVVINICLVPPEVFQKISEVIQKYLLD